MAENLLSVQRELSDSDSRQNIPFSFTVPDGCIGLSIRFSYSPKQVTDSGLSRRLIEEELTRCGVPDLSLYPWTRFCPLVNLVTLSLDDAKGIYRGAAHRHDSEQVITLTADTASPGFYPGPLHAGIWKAVVSCHCVVDRCGMQLVVEGVTGHA